MARRKPPAANRDARLARPVRWLLLALAGAIAGVTIGEHVAGSRLDPVEGARREGGGGYAGFSANPDALAADTVAAPACVDCADSYGAAARLRARRAERGDAGLDATGAIHPDPAPEPIDDYHYGGRFPDPDPAPSAPAAPEGVAPGDDAPPPD